MTHAAAIFKLRQFLSTDRGNIDYLSFSFRGDFECCHAFSLSFTTVCSMVVNDRAGTRELPIEPRGASPDDRTRCRSAASSVNLLKILETCVNLTASWGGSLDRGGNFYSPHQVSSIRSVTGRLAPPNSAS